MAVTLFRPQSGATAYEVYDYFGSLISSGSIAGTTFSIIDPVGGWKCGWYRCRLTGPNTDPVFGSSYGAFNFVVIRDTSGYAQNVSGPTFRSIGHGGESRDEYLHGILGIPGPRLQIGSTLDLGGSDSLAVCEASAQAIVDHQRTDSVRGNPIFCQFPNGASDYGIVYSSAGTSESNHLVPIFAQTGIDGSNVYYDSDNGTSSGFRIRIYYPDASTLVEDYDNLSSPDWDSLTASSSYVMFQDYGASTWAIQPPQAIGNTRYNNTKAAATALYALGVHYFEGPRNEPRLDIHFGQQIAKETQKFSEAIKAGAPLAKVIGPTQVNLDVTSTNGGWADGFSGASGLTFLDELAMHAYGSNNNGDFNFLRAAIEQFKTDLATISADTMPLWITESTNVFSSVAGVYHPRRSRMPIITSLVWEEYGVPREKNLVWYDVSHGFWAYPSWMEHADGSLNPYAVLYRVLSEETFEKTFHHRIDFAGLTHANALMLGQVYTGTDNSSTAVFTAASYLDNGTVTLNLDGTVPSSVVWVDGFGNETTVTPSSGRITIPVSEIPVYVRLPAGTHCSVYSVNDWGHSSPPNIALTAIPSLGSTTQKGLTDGDYGTSVSTSDALPTSASLLWNDTVSVDRVIIFAGVCWQHESSLVDFDVQTTTDGTTWTTRTTITKDVSSLRFGTDSTNAGCTFETFWDEQHKFDVSLGASYSCTGVRVYVRSTSYGGEPDAQAATGGFGQGETFQKLVLHQLVVPSSSSPALWTSPYPTVIEGDSPVGYWRFNETQGATTLVSEVNSPTQDATYVSGTLGVSGAIADGTTAAQVLGTQLMTVADNSFLHIGDLFSIECWIKTNSGASHNVFLGWGSGSTTQPALEFANGYMTLRDKNNSFVQAQSNVAGNDGTWHHWVVTKNGSTAKVYRDGIDVTASPPTHLPAPLTVKSFTYSNSATGALSIGSSVSIDELAIYATELSSTQVAHHYSASSTPGGTPVNSTLPTITGTATKNYQLVCSQGTWGGNPVVYGYQWQTSTDGSTGWTDITGASYHTYVPVSGDVNNYLRCQVTATNATATSTTVSTAATGKIS